MSDSLKSMPCNSDAEKAVLSCMLLSTDEVLPEAKARLTSEHFYIPAHRRIYDALIELSNLRSGDQIDLVILSTELTNRGEIDQVGGPAALADILDDVPSASLFGDYLTFLDVDWKRRQLIAKATEGIMTAYDDAHSVDEVDSLLKGLSSDCENILASSSTESFTSIKQGLSKTLEVIAERHQQGGGIPGISTGMSQLDALTNGYQAGQQWIIGARPSVGKSAMILTLASLLLKAGVPVGIFSPEMTEEQMLIRMLAAEARLDSLSLARGSMSKASMSKLSQSFSKTMGWPLFMCDKRGITSAEIGRQARQMVKKHGVKVIFVDYLQKVKSASKHERRDLEVAAVSNDLFNMAGDLEITTVVAAQLSRLPKGQKNYRPTMGDLRESGSIEQDADVIGLLHRIDDVEEVDQAPEEVAKNNQARVDWILEKTRNGSTGNIEMLFDKPRTYFTQVRNA